MNKKLTYKLILFVGLVIILDQSIGYLISNIASKYHVDKRIELLLNNKLDKDLFILGSSRALNGIDPKTIQEQTNLSCYNMAVSGSNIEYHETILDLILQSKNQPKTIIYNLDDPGTLTLFTGKVIYQSQQLYPYVNNDFVNGIIAHRLEKKEWSTKVSATYRQNVNFMTAVKYLVQGKEEVNMEINNLDEYGANLMVGKSKGYEEMVYKESNPFQYNGEHQPYVDAFDRIISKCRKNNIRLMLVIPPVFFKTNKEFKNRIIELVNNQCEIYDYSAVFKDDSLFYNYGHLNKFGAQEYSKLLAKDILK